MYWLYVFCHVRDDDKNPEAETKFACLHAE